jgi:hypothetical protein
VCVNFNLDMHTKLGFKYLRCLQANALIQKAESLIAGTVKAPVTSAENALGRCDGQVVGEAELAMRRTVIALYSQAVKVLVAAEESPDSDQRPPAMLTSRLGGMAASDDSADVSADMERLEASRTSLRTASSQCSRLPTPASCATGRRTVVAHLLRTCRFGLATCYSRIGEFQNTIDCCTEMIATDASDSRALT